FGGFQKLVLSLECLEHTGVPPSESLFIPGPPCLLVHLIPPSLGFTNQVLSLPAGSLYETLRLNRCSEDLFLNDLSGIGYVHSCYSPAFVSICRNRMKRCRTSSSDICLISDHIADKDVCSPGGTSFSSWSNSSPSVRRPR